MNEQLIDLLLAGIYAYEAKLTRDEIANAARQKFAEGATPEQVSAYLRELRDAKLAELNQIELGSN